MSVKRSRLRRASSSTSLPEHNIPFLVEYYTKMNFHPNITGTQEIIHTSSLVSLDLLPAIQTYEGHFIEAVWVRRGYPLNLVISHVESRLGAGWVYILLADGFSHLLYGINVPTDFVEVLSEPEGEFIRFELSYYEPAENPLPNAVVPLPTMEAPVEAEFPAFFNGDLPPIVEVITPPPVREGPNYFGDYGPLAAVPHESNGTTHDSDSDEGQLHGM